MTARSSIVPYLKRSPVLWIAALFMLPGLVFGTIGLAVAAQDARFAIDGASAPGIVLTKDIRRATGSSGTSYSVRYRFAASGDQTYEGSSTVDVHDWERLVERGPITVQYLASDPSTNRPLGSSSLLFSVLFLAIAAFTLPVAGYFLWRELRTLREDRRLLRTGKEAPATVASVEPTNVSINRRIQWAISYAYRDAGGKQHHGRSWTMSEAQAKKFEPGDHGTILYDPDRPELSLWLHKAPSAKSGGAAVDAAT